ncbi:MAG TPA: hypothetical protein VGE76_08040, partial [Opitutaceae bacterium]
PDMWSRLWANAFLLRKEQYFLTHTYEGRLNTPLRGEWDLEGGTVAVMLPTEARRQVTPRFALVDTRHPAFVRIELGAGWHPPEIAPGSTEIFQWTAGEATLRLTNPHAYPLAIDSTLDGWSPAPRRLSLVREGGESGPSAAITEKRIEHTLPALSVPPGESALFLRSAEPPYLAPGDPRPLGTAVFRLRVTPKKD